MKCKYCNKEIGDRDQEECMINPHRDKGDPSTDDRPEYGGKPKDQPSETDGELKPCPFCGGEAELKQHRRDGLTIRCKKCSIKRVQRVKTYSLEWLEETMRKAWNQRA